jgi:hypothetical protein
MSHRSFHPEAARLAKAAANSAGTWGVVQRVDTVQRELTVLTDDGLKIFDVPVGCPIFLHGERIKLRLIQSGDRVNIRFFRGNESLVAHCVQVQPDATIAALRR